MKSDKKKNTILINLIAGPGCGKSTIAAMIFAKLKCLDIDAELINEYAKQLVWEQSFPKMKNQIYIFGKQHNKQWMLNGKLDVMITDSPLLLNVYYDNNQTKGLKDFILAQFHTFNNLNILLKRQSKYNPNGRTQTEAQAKKVDKEVKQLLIKNNIKYEEYEANEDSVNLIVKSILKKLKYKKPNG